MKRPAVRLATLALLVAGCVSPGSYARISGRIPPVPRAMGRLMFFRPFAESNSLRPEILVDGVSVGHSEPKGFLFADLPPGTHAISTSNLAEHDLELELPEGEVRYVKLTSTVRQMATHIVPSVASEAIAMHDLRTMVYTGDPDLLLAP